MIDVHAHVVLEGALGCAGHYGPELGTGPEGRPRSGWVTTCSTA